MHALARRPIRIVLSLVVVFTAFSSSATEAAEPVPFGVVADLHAPDTDSPLEGKWRTNPATWLASLTEAMHACSPEFVIELGDFVNGWVVFGAELGDPGRIPEVLAWAEQRYAAFDGPRYHVLGHHDVYHLDKPTYLDVLAMEATNDSFDVGACHFIALDVPFAPDGDDFAHTYTGVGGYLPEAQWAWLRDDLAASRRPTVVFVQQMLTGYVAAWGRELMLNAPVLRETLAEHGDVIAVCQGHDHDSHLQHIDGIADLTFEALVDQGTPASWARVTLDPMARTIVVDAVGDQDSHRLTYSVKAEEKEHP